VREKMVPPRMPQAMAVQRKMKAIAAMRLIMVSPASRINLHEVLCFAKYNLKPGIRGLKR